jgi:hypothetical protein
MRGASIVFLTVLFAGLLLTGGHLHAPDDEVMFRLSQSIALRGALSVEPIEQDFATMAGRDGRHFPQYGVGQAVVAAPLVWAGKILGAVLGEKARALAFSETTRYFAGDNPSEIAQRFTVSFFNIFVAAALAGVLYAFALRVVGRPREAAAAALTYGLATYALAHSRTFFSEPLATLCVLGAVALLHTGIEERSTRRLIFGGALAGASVLVRVDSVVTWPALLVGLFWGLWPSSNEERRTKDEGRKQTVRALAAFLVPMAAGALCVAMLNGWRFGNPLATGYGDQPEGVRLSTPLLIGLHGFLCSPGRGLFFFSPPLILALWAFGSLWRRDRKLCLTVGLLIASVLAFHSKWQNWSGGWDWGPRHIFLIHVFLALPIAAWLAEAPKNMARWRVLAVLFAVGLAVQVYGSSQDPLVFYRQMYVTPESEPNFRVLYSPTETMFHQGAFRVLRRAPDGRWVEDSPSGLGAPINDSVYVPQNGCWFGYAYLADLGHHDLLWLHALIK